MAGSKSSRRLLVADDDPAIRKLLKQILEQAGYAVQTCEDGKSAAQALSRGGYALAVLDVEMPHQSGLDVVESLRAAGDSTPAILISGNLSEQVLQRSGALAGVLTMAKPLEIARFLEAVARAVGGPP
jgi:CheY-like chemotaxis protein